VVCHLHLLFQHGDALGEVVVRPHLAGQLLKLDGYMIMENGRFQWKTMTNEVKMEFADGKRIL